MTRPIGFTLVELLVVITIIVVLVSLLAPALDAAVYAAEMAVCAAQLDGIASASQGYAMGFKRRYPHRTTGNEAHRITSAKGDPFGNPGVGIDDRPVLRMAFPIKMLLCPFAKSPVNFDIDPPGESSIYTSYRLYFSFQWEVNDQPRPSMLRLGDSWEWDGVRYNVMAADEDWINNANNQQANASHPDKEGVMALGWSQMGGLAPVIPFTLSEWHSPNSNYKRGPLDTQYAMEDGSVERFNDVRWDVTVTDPTGEMTRVPHFHHGGDWFAAPNPGSWNHVPRR